jgi:hypothetical protein
VHVRGGRWSRAAFACVLVTLAIATPSASAGWTAPPTPNAAGANLSTLAAVDCTSPSNCIAVGHADNGGSRVTLAEHWDGTSWTITPTPNPPGATLASLSGVSCPRDNVCFAVGGSSSGPLVELWTGTSWTIQPSDSVAGGELDAVSCSGLLACTAVGQYANANSRLTLAERWDATGWHVQSTPNPAGAESSRLAGVSCPVKRTCTAVGGSTVNGVTAPLVARWFGRVNAWGEQAAPKPAGAESADLAAVSCPAPLPCFATGDSTTPDSPPTTSSVTSTLAERRVGSTWSVLATPNPPQGPGVNQSRLFGVSCPTQRFCKAVGTSTDLMGPVPIAQGFDGATWQLEPVPVTGAFPLLAGVSCPTRLFCMAVGGNSFRFSGTTLSSHWTP